MRWLASLLSGRLGGRGTRPERARSGGLETRPSPIKLPGPWCFGLALAVHSEGDLDSPERTDIARLLVRFKYGGEGRLAAVLGGELAAALAAPAREAGIDLVTHVPTSRRNSYEPACELAVAVARHLRLRALPRLMRTVRPIRPQKDLTTVAAKAANVEGAFGLRRPDLVRGRKLLVVDDVYDSGTTLLEAYRVLRQAGAQAIAVATVTRTRHPGALM
jgi:predicted amidophosphoribosyltransferase